jgi:DNA repair exonuclease SbcCD ATPase subunit
MADSIIEQIKKGKALVAKLQKAIADMEADGVDADEAKRIEQNKSQIAQLMVELTKLEQQFEADKKEWNGLSGDLKTARDQLKTLKDWGSFDLASFESALSAIEGFETSEDYRDAINRLGELKTALTKPYAEYTRQLEAKGKYETDLKDIEARLGEAKSSKFQTDAVVKGISQVEHNLPAVKKQADAKDYVAANGLLVSAASELGLVE